jgi:hypothetical protein
MLARLRQRHEQSSALFKEAMVVSLEIQDPLYRQEIRNTTPLRSPARRMTRVGPNH